MPADGVGGGGHCSMFLLHLGTIRLIVLRIHYLDENRPSGNILRCFLPH